MDTSVTLTRSKELELETYLNEYLSVCRENKVRVLLSVRKTLESSISNGVFPEKLILDGNSDDLRHSRIYDGYLDVVLGPMIRQSFYFLKTLSLAYNEITDKGAMLIAQFLKEDRFLQVLCLKSNSISGKGAVAIAQSLLVNERLEDLDLSYNAIDDEGGMEIARMLQVNAGLQRLSVAGCSLRATSMIALWTVLKNNETLIDFDISDNITNSNCLSQSLANDVVMHLSGALKGSTTLKRLGLRKMAITDWSTCDYLADALSSCFSLEYLDLSCNRISRDGGIQICKAFSRHLTIQELKLSHCSLQDEGAHAICDLLLSNTSLKRLHLESNGITGKGLTAISKAVERNISVTHIYLWGNAWNVPSCEAFAPLVGGPIYQVSYGDDLTLPSLPRGVGLYDDPDTDVLVRKKSGKSRLNPKCTDFVFYTIEGELDVACQ